MRRTGRDVYRAQVSVTLQNSWVRWIMFCISVRLFIRCRFWSASVSRNTPQIQNTTVPWRVWFRASAQCLRLYSPTNVIIGWISGGKKRVQVIFHPEITRTIIHLIYYKVANFFRTINLFLFSFFCIVTSAISLQILIPVIIKKKKKTWFKLYKTFVNYQNTVHLIYCIF